MAKFRIVPYRQGSRGAKELADALPRGRVLKLEGSKFVPTHEDVIINWGNTQGFPIQIPRAMGVPIPTVLNFPDDIRLASNKLIFFNTMREEGLNDIIPEFWTRRGDIPDDAFPIVCRTVLAGHSGAGIHLANNRNELVDAPLYVRYIKKEHEYRVHVGNTDESIIIAVQRKARREGFENPNWQIRNHDNGFVFVRNGFNPPQAVLDAARRSFEATNLDFGAVDVIWNSRQERAYVLEINTAPGLEGQTIEDYAAFFRTFA